MTNRSRAPEARKQNTVEIFLPSELCPKFNLFLNKKYIYIHDKEKPNSYDKGKRVAIGFIFFPPTLFKIKFRHGEDSK